MTEKDFLEKYPEFKKLIEQHIPIDAIKEILDKHFVRLKDAGKLEIFNRTWIERQKVKDAIDKLIPDPTSIGDGNTYESIILYRLKKDLGLDE